MYIDAFGKETFHAFLEKTSYLQFYIFAYMHFICNMKTNLLETDGEPKKKHWTISSSSIMSSKIMKVVHLIY